MPLRIVVCSFSAQKKIALARLKIICIIRLQSVVRLSSQEGVTQVSKYEIISLALSAGSFVLALLTYVNYRRLKSPAWGVKPQIA